MKNQIEETIARAQAYENDPENHRPERIAEETGLSVSEVERIIEKKEPQMTPRDAVGMHLAFQRIENGDDDL